MAYLKVNGKLVMNEEGQLITSPEVASQEELLVAQSETIDEMVADTEVMQLVEAFNSGSPKEVFATLGDLNTKYPNGTNGVMLVIDNGHWYYYYNNAWTDGGVYQATQVPDGSITPQKTNFFTRNNISLIKGTLNKSSINNITVQQIGNRFILNTSGATDTTNFFVTDWISVEGEKYVYLDEYNPNCILAFLRKSTGQLAGIVKNNSKFDFGAGEQYSFAITVLKDAILNDFEIDLMISEELQEKFIDYDLVYFDNSKIGIKDVSKSQLDNELRIKADLISESLNNKFDYYFETDSYENTAVMSGLAPIFRMYENISGGSTLGYSLKIKCLDDVILKNKNVNLFLSINITDSLLLIGSHILEKTTYIKGEYIILEGVLTINQDITSVLFMPYFQLMPLGIATTKWMFEKVELKINDNEIISDYCGEMFHADNVDTLVKDRFSNKFDLTTDDNMFNYDLLNQKNVVFIGDSITEGDYGYEPGLDFNYGLGSMDSDTHPNIKEKNYPYFFQKKSKCNVFNIGRCGIDAKNERNHVRRMDFSDKDVALIMLGTNLGLDGTIGDVSTELGAYADIIDYINESSQYRCKIFLLQPIFNNLRTKEFNNINYKNVRIVAQAKNVKVIDTNKCLGINIHNYRGYLNKSDKCHPNELGYKKLGEYVFMKVIQNMENY